MKTVLQTLTKNEQEVLEKYRKELSVFKANRNFVKNYLKRFLGKRYIESYEEAGYKAVTLYKVKTIFIKNGYIYLNGIRKTIDLNNTTSDITLCNHWIKSDNKSLKLDFLNSLKEISLEKYQEILKKHSGYLNRLNKLIK